MRFAVTARLRPEHAAELRRRLRDGSTAPAEGAAAPDGEPLREHLERLAG